MANALLDSRTPRRLTAASTTMKPTAISTRNGLSTGHRRDDVVDAGGDRHGDRHDVVDEQRRGDDEPGLLAEVLAGDLVVAAARRVGLDQLAVREHDDEQQHDDRERDPRPEGEEPEPADQQDHQQLLRRVRHRGERVAREDRQREVLGEQLPLELVGGERIADQPVLGCVRECVSSGSAGVTLRRRLRASSVTRDDCTPPSRAVNLGSSG